MDFEKVWHEALKKTEIVRNRVQALLTTGQTQVPYILLCESSINHGDTVVRKGRVMVDKPSLIVPPNHPKFVGFDFDQEDSFKEDTLINFLILRGVTFPSFRYDNQTSSLDIYEGKLSGAVSAFQKTLQEREDVHTGLIIGHEDYWQFSLIVFICAQIVKNADNDIRKLLAEFKRQGGQNN